MAGTLNVDRWRDERVVSGDDGTEYFGLRLEVRPSRGAEADLSEPPHAFVATAKLTPYLTDDDGKSVDGPEQLVYWGEHGSLAAGVRACNRAAKRARRLRLGEEGWYP